MYVMSRSTIVTIAALTVIVSGLLVWLWYTQLGHSSGEQTSAQRSLSSNDTVASFTALDGTERSLDEYVQAGGYILVTSWASWCPQCTDHLQQLDSLIGQSTADVTALAINRRERPNQAQHFLRTIGDLEHLEFVLDPEDRFYRDIEGFTIPETILYDPAGDILLHFHGTLSSDDVAQISSVLP